MFACNVLEGFILFLRAQNVLFLFLDGRFDVFLSFSIGSILLGSLMMSKLHALFFSVASLIS